MNSLLTAPYTSAFISSKSSLTTTSSNVVSSAGAIVLFSVSFSSFETFSDSVVFTSVVSTTVVSSTVVSSNFSSVVSSTSSFLVSVSSSKTSSASGSSLSAASVSFSTSSFSSSNFSSLLVLDSSTNSKLSKIVSSVVVSTTSSFLESLKRKLKKPPLATAGKQFVITMQSTRLVAINFLKKRIRGPPPF